MTAAPEAATGDAEDAPQSSRRPRLSRFWYPGAWLVAIAITVGIAGWIHWSVGGERVSTIATNLVLALTAVGAFAVLVDRASATEGENRRGWWLIAIGISLWAFAEVLWFAYDLWLGAVPYPGIADVFWLAGYPFLAAGFVSFTDPRQQVSPVLQVVLLGLLVGLSFLTFSWHFVIEPLVTVGDFASVSVWVSVAYPVLDTVIATLAFVVALYRRGRQRIPLVLLAVGFIAFLVVDTAFAAQEFAQGYAVTVLDTLWIVGYLFIALGAIYYVGRETRRPRRRYTFAELSAGYVPFLAAMGLAGYLVTTGEFSRADLYLVGLVAVALILHQLFLNRDVDQLGEQLVQREATLERRNRELDEMTRRLEAVFHTVEAVIVMKDTDGRYLIANRWAKELAGRDPADDVSGLTDDDVMPPAIAEQFRDWDREIIETGETVEVDVEIPTPEGPMVLHGNSSPILDDAGNVRGICAVATDVTEAHERERRLEVMNEQLRVLNRIVRHDIRNDMNVALGWSEELGAHVDPEGRTILHRIENAHKHVVDLTRVVRDFVDALGTGDQASLEATSVKAHLEQELDKRRSNYPGATFVVEGDIPDVSVSANELLSSVFRNVLNNAVQHNDEDEPHVSVSVDVDESAVTVRIADNGPGIPAEQRDAIFGRTGEKLEDPSAGIGLYLVDSLVDDFGGEVHVEDHDPEGSVFVIELPRLAGDLDERGWQEESIEEDHDVVGGQDPDDQG